MTNTKNVSKNSIVKIAACAFAALLLASSMLFAGCSGSSGDSSSASSTSATATQTITDNAGDTVTVPTQIDKIADLWHAHNQIVLMLGAGDKLVGTTENFKKRAWANEVYPGLANVEALVTGTGAGEVNYEEALSLEPDVVFTSDKEVTASCRQQGLTTVNVTFNNYDGLRNDVKLTGQILGSDAEKIAGEWEDLLDKNIKTVEDKMASVSDADRVKVLHIVGANSFTKVDGVDTIVDEWIRLAGGVNAITASGNQIDVTMEDIVAADPDVIIIGSGTDETVAQLMADSAWSGITAVKNGAVYGNPSGVFAWDRYSGEEALQVLWAAQKLNPDLFGDIDMVKETQDFYKTFYGYTLSEDGARRILSGQDPA